MAARSAFQVENVMASVAAVWALGLELGHSARGPRGFRADQDNARWPIQCV
jgi:UDP-N-acetylmuramyl tripeptide synthase